MRRLDADKLFAKELRPIELAYERIDGKEYRIRKIAEQANFYDKDDYPSFDDYDEESDPE